MTAAPGPVDGAQPPMRFGYRRHADQDRTPPARHPVVIVGAGPVGLALAIDLAQRDVAVVLLDNDEALATGSRAICFAKRSLEIFDRLGCGQRMVDKGVSWSVGKVHFGDDEVYRFDLLDAPGHERPAFINLQQYHVERFLVDRALALPAIDLRWRHEVTGLEPRGEAVALTIATPDGPYGLLADHLVACDGSRSTLRRLAGVTSSGRTFRDRFLIADVRMQADFPAERWFWFDPPFHRGQSVLLHKQPDGLWRIDFQLGWDADPEREKQPERILPRVEALLAHTALRDAPFELEWASVYTFACTRMASFRVGRVLFAGDAAHGVSPFGARGANSGLQDADNLGWKLAAVVRRRGGDALLDSYAREREAAADENLRQSTRSTDFITPKSEASRLFRDAVLDLARTHLFARTLVNSGRLSLPATLDGSPLNTPDDAPFDGSMRPGAAAQDAPIELADGSSGWLLRALGDGFTLMLAFAADRERGAGSDADADADADAGGRTGATAGAGAEAGDERDRAGRPPLGPRLDELRTAAEGLAELKILRVAISPARVTPADPRRPGDAAQRGRPGEASSVADAERLVVRRYDLHPGTAYLFRPDQHVCARWRRVSAPAVRAALVRSLGLDTDVPFGPSLSKPSVMTANPLQNPLRGNDASDPEAPPMLLNTAPHLDAPDDFYEALIDAHRDLEPAASHALNARLVLLLANHVGRADVLGAALAAARASLPPSNGLPP